MITKVSVVSLLAAAICTLPGHANQGLGPFDTLINPVAVKSVLSQPVSDNINKDAFANCLRRDEKISLYSLMECCTRNIDESFSSDQKIAECQVFVRQVASEHTDIVDGKMNNGVKSISSKTYSYDGNFYMSRTDEYGLNEEFNYGVFSAKNNEFMCFLNCFEKSYEDTPCTRDGWDIFMCDTNSQGKSTQKLLVGRKVDYDKDYGGYKIEYKTSDKDKEPHFKYTSVIEDYVDQMRHYKAFQQAKRPDAGDTDFLDCKNYLERSNPVQQKQYQYLIPSKKYNEYIQDYNGLLNAGKDMVTKFGNFIDGLYERDWSDYDFYTHCSELADLYSKIKNEEKTYDQVEQALGRLDSGSILIKAKNINSDNLQEYAIKDINNRLTTSNPLDHRTWTDYRFGYDEVTEKDCRFLDKTETPGAIGAISYMSFGVECKIYNSQLNKEIKAVYIYNTVLSKVDY